MKGNTIIVSALPGGHFFEGILDSSLTGDMLKPGRVLKQKPSVAPVGGRFTFLDWTAATDGAADQIVILLDDPISGRIPTTSYTAGRRAPMYQPVPGDEMNIQALEGAGTSNSVAIGDKFMVDKDQGTLIPYSGTPAGPTFQAQEVLTQVAADTLLWVRVGN